MSKNILITGTSSGFGNDAVRTLAAAGYQVFAGMRDVSSRNREVALEFQSKGIVVVELDVTSNQSVDAAFKVITEKTSGKLDVLINNAGLFSHGISEAYSPEQMRDLYEINVFGVQRVVRAALPNMRKNKSGLVINISSVLGRVTIPFLGLYGGSKFALEAMTESYRYELSQFGVDVVLIEPSAYPTGLYHALQKPADAARITEYGEIASIPEQFGAFLGSVFQSPEAPNSHDVAEALLKLIATPAGQRSPRVVVGQPYGADAVNAAIQPIQAGVISGVGMDALNTLKVS
jgi:NAD(P)-dependent dehydrogenase (short-subunit alcohol dehydrogenase family)